MSTLLIENEPIPDARLIALRHWLQTTLPSSSWTLQQLAGDASFRRYFRVTLSDQTLIAMDAPPPQEDTRPFIAIAQAFAKLAVTVPEIIAADPQQGFLLLSDFGDQLYSQILNENNADSLYQKALAVLPRIQACREFSGWTLPHFNHEFIRREWNLFYQWVLEKHWQLTPSFEQQTILTNAFEFLLQEISAQPTTCVHRDYHSRNLLLLKNNAVGVLDFQDAVWGPIPYDAVSLLRDCYVVWPHEQVRQWALHYYQQSRDHGLLNKQISSEQFMRWFDLLGIQRHLKAVGIFARLKHLYHKSNYLQDIPRGLNYILQVSENYPELKKFRALLQTHCKKNADNENSVFSC